MWQVHLVEGANVVLGNGNEEFVNLTQEEDGARETGHRFQLGAEFFEFLDKNGNIEYSIHEYRVVIITSTI